MSCFFFFCASSVIEHSTNTPCVYRAMGSQHCSAVSRGDLARRSKFPYKTSTARCPRGFSHRRTNVLLFLFLCLVRHRTQHEHALRVSCYGFATLLRRLPRRPCKAEQIPVRVRTMFAPSTSYILQSPFCTLYFFTL